MKRALLIGSPVGGLTGTRRDIDGMTGLLRPRGFEIVECFGENASRDGIIDAWNNLINQSVPDDVVVIYYTGHGGRPIKPNPFSSYVPLHFIVPFDFGSSHDDFRGITSIELNRMLKKLVKRTDNVTIILDCCFATNTVRRAGLKTKAIPEIEYELVASHVKTLREDGSTTENCAPGNSFVEGNPNAVRVFAVEADKEAFEIETHKDLPRMSVLTNALIQTLANTDWNRLCWVTAQQRWQAKIDMSEPGQDTNVEGPTRRVLFSLEEMDIYGVLPVQKDYSSPIKAVLEGGRLHGVTVGDSYALVPFEDDIFTPEQEFAEAHVVNVHIVTADLVVKYRGEFEAFPSGHAFAFPRKSSKRMPFRVQSSGSGLITLLSREIDNSKYAEMSTIGEDKGTALVHISENTASIFDPSEICVYKESLDNISDKKKLLHRLLTRIAILTHKNRLLNVDVDRAHKLLIDCDVIFSIIETGESSRSYLFESDDNVELKDGQFFGIMVKNRGEKTIYASFFDVCATGTVSRLTNHPHGIEIASKGSFTLGTDDSSGELVGFELTWPQELPHGNPVGETIVVVLTSTWVDLQCLETYGVRSRELVRGSCLSQLATEEGVRYDIRRFKFSLAPKD